VDCALQCWQNTLIKCGLLNMWYNKSPVQNVRRYDNSGKKGAVRKDRYQRSGTKRSYLFLLWILCNPDCILVCLNETGRTSSDRYLRVQPCSPYRFLPSLCQSYVQSQVLQYLLWCNVCSESTQRIGIGSVLRTLYRPHQVRNRRDPPSS
jgi:hypothetical protein